MRPIQSDSLRLKVHGLSLSIEANRGMFPVTSGVERMQKFSTSRTVFALPDCFPPENWGGSVCFGNEPLTEIARNPWLFSTGSPTLNPRNPIGFEAQRQGCVWRRSRWIEQTRGVGSPCNHFAACLAADRHSGNESRSFRMRARFLITAAVGFGLILAGPIETTIHQRAQARVFQYKSRMFRNRVVEP
jgi:hypothetical protein